MAARFGFFSAILLLAMSVVACAKKQPTEYDLYKERRLAKMTLNVIKLNGVLKDYQGNGVSGVRVAASSPRYEEEDRTANDGHFYVVAKFAPGDIIDFHFQGNRVEWTESLSQIPGGIEKLRLNFRLEKSGVIRLASLEY